LTKFNTLLVPSFQAYLCYKYIASTLGTKRNPVCTNLPD